MTTSIIKKARLKGLAEIEAVDIREFTDDKHNRVDEYPFGGGQGMIMKCQPVLDCLKSVRTPQSRVLLMGPTGQRFTQAKARELVKQDHLILLCGHYEGFDARIRAYVDEETEKSRKNEKNRKCRIEFILYGVLHFVLLSFVV